MGQKDKHIKGHKGGKSGIGWEKREKGHGRVRERMNRGTRHTTSKEEDKQEHTEKRSRNIKHTHRDNTTGHLKT